MRSAFMNFLLDKAAQDERIFLVVGDVGFSVVEPFIAQFPTRYLNAGVAEQNMIGVAAGLAMAGKKVYVYTIIPFLVMRAYEQIRVDLCYQELDVTLVGVGGGLSYGPMGATHHALEDIALMRALPGMRVIAPGSVAQTAGLCADLYHQPGPAYVRLSNTSYNQPVPVGQALQVGKALQVAAGDDCLLISTGNALEHADKLRLQLAQHGVHAALTSMHTCKPLDTDYLEQAACSYPWIFVLEEHSVIGGLGEAVASQLFRIPGATARYAHFGLADSFLHQAGSRDYLVAQSGLDVQQLCGTIMSRMSL